MFCFRRRFSFVAFVLTIALWATTASAGDELSEEEVEEEAAADEGDMQRAQEAFDRGARHYYADEYSDAVVEFRRANQIQSHPIFKHNIALANREMGRMDRALDWAERAEAHDVDLPEETQATNLGIIQGSRVALQAPDRAEDFGVAEPEPVAGTPDDEPEPVDDAGFGALGWGGVVGAVIGGAMLGGSAIVDRQIVAGIDQLEEDRDSGAIDGTEFDNRRDSLASQQTTGRILLFSGAGVAAVGATLVIVELVSGGADDRRDVAVAPSIDRPGIDLLVRW